MLAIPPGFASAVWPASGAALFCVIYFNRWGSLLGVALGSFLLNLGIVAQNVGQLQISHALPPLIIASGAALQAQLGYFLFRRFVGGHELPDSHKKIIRFLFIVAPLGCVVAPVVGVNILHLTGIISAENYWFSLGTWWTGDTIGVLLFTPFLLAIASPVEQVSQTRKLQICIPILLIFSVVLLLFFKSLSVQKYAVSKEIEENASRFVAQISERLINAGQVLRAYEAYFAGSERVTRSEFEHFSKILLDKNTVFQGVGWTEVIDHNRRLTIEANMRQEGDADFRFMELDGEGRLVEAPRRESYYPVLYIYPQEANHRALGLNLSANETRLKALEKARISKTPVATEPLVLAQEKSGQLALILYHPVFKENNGPGSSKQPEEPMFLGYISGIIRFSSIIQRSIEPLLQQNFGVTVTDNSDLNSPVVLTRIGDEPWSQFFPVQETIDFGGRRITTSTYATSHYQVSSKDWTSWTIITGGLIIAAILQGLILIITGGTAIIKRQVKLKTEALTAAMEKLEKANLAKSAFTSTMSHEIRTPLNGIIGLLNQCLKTEMNERQFYYLNQAKLSSDTLLSLVNSILDFSKIESEKLEIEASDFSLLHVLQKMQAIFTELANQKGIVFNLVLPNQMPAELCGDALRIEQILLNLCGNAVKFTQVGEVTLQVALKEEREGITLFITVSDTGIGISQEQLAHLFKSYQQADSSMSRRFGGTGLGLTITKRLIEKMAGVITVNSKEGQGSQFHVQLTMPRGTNSSNIDCQDIVNSRPEKELNDLDEGVLENKRTTRVSPKVKALTGLSVLVVEDVAINQLIAKEILQEHGAMVTVADNGIHALSQLQDGIYDVVLMDVQMPEKDGYETTQIIRKLPKYKSLPIIAMTANVLRSDIDKAREAGMDDHIAKPIDEKTMVAKVVHYASQGKK